METKKVVLIAGGTGFIGRKLQEILAQNFEVRILSRNKEKCGGNCFYWNPDENELDENALLNVNHIVNLCGAGITDKRWTKKRKQELLNSRTIPASFLFSKRDQLNQLESYISASGLNCYELSNTSKIYTEKDGFGSDYVSNLVREWEKAADVFDEITTVCKLRTGFVLSNEGGGLSKMKTAIRLGLGSAFGTGKQKINWIHLNDLCATFKYALEHKLAGSFNTFSQETTNLELSKTLAKVMHKPFFMPKVPSFILKLILGELSVLVLEGIQASNEKLLQTGFKFQETNLEQALSK